MTGTEIAQLIATGLYLVATVFSLLTVKNNKRAERAYRQAADDYIAENRKWLESYKMNLQLYEEEIKLLKTNEGLYGLRENEEQYQTYLTLLRKEQNGLCK